MAKVFTVSFLYNGQDHSAIITHLNKHVTIELTTDTLNHILPGGRFCFNVEQGIPISKGRVETKDLLLLSIVAAIEKRTAEH